MRAWSDRTSGDGFKLKEGRFRLDLRKNLFMLRVVRSWPRLPREVGDAPLLEPFQARLDGALSTLIWLEMSLPMAGGWTGWPGKVPSHPNQSVVDDSMTKHKLAEMEDLASLAHCCVTARHHNVPDIPTSFP